MTPAPLHPDAIRALDTSLTWSVEPRRVGYRLRAHGLWLPEKSTAFALTRRGAERKARRRSAPPQEPSGAYTPLPTRPSPMQGETGKGYRK